MLGKAIEVEMKHAHDEFERVRGRVWIERIRVGLEYRRAMRAIDEGVARARVERDVLIRRAVEGGASYREVARALGLSHSRIQQIVNEGRASARAPHGPAPSRRRRGTPER